MELLKDTAEVEDAEGIRAVRLRIPAKPEYIALGRLALTGLAQARRLDSDTVADLKLALTEAVSNSVRHAYDGEGEGQVEIRYELRADRITVEIVDDGAGFDPEEAPSFAGEELSEGGLGIAIIRTLADDVEIESRPGVRGSRLRFVKNL
ncbi:MAG: ATP-binding protein [Acidobacteriota bacterium]|nr:ATP-binding protein [Acidobacteriota bacterium]MDE3190824.1 ATP-binding protein [Acidobacteriota bacterium]